MIKDLSIQNFKGIENGSLNKLSKVNILVGPNNTGKSTILDAVYLLSNLYSMEDPLGNSQPDYTMAKKAGRAHRDALHYKYDTENTISFELLVNENIGVNIATYESGTWEFNNAFSMVDLKEEESGKVERKFLDIDRERAYDALHDLQGRGLIGERVTDKYRILGDSLAGSLYFHSGIFEVFPQIEREVWERLVFDRKDKVVIRKLNDIYESDVENLTFVPINDTNYELRVLFDDYSSRIDSLGDGFRYLFSLISAVESFDANTILVEEPENHQHPNTYGHISDTLVDYSIEKGSQTFIATHSYEMIDSVLQSCKETNADVSIYHLNLEGGELESRSIDAPDVEVLEDLGIDPRRLKEYE